MRQSPHWLNSKGESPRRSRHRDLGLEFNDSEATAFWEAELARVIEYWGSQPQETQLDRIEAKLDRIIKKLSA